MLLEEIKTCSKNRFIWSFSLWHCRANTVVSAETIHKKIWRAYGEKDDTRVPVREKKGVKYLQM